jgi:uncharacterized membrane protein YgcG
MCAIFYFMGSLANGTLVAAAVIALIVAFIVYGSLVGQLKQAASVLGAGNYMVKDSFQLFTRRDYYLHTTQTRRKIEQKQENKA